MGRIHCPHGVIASFILGLMLTFLIAIRTLESGHQQLRAGIEAGGRVSAVVAIKRCTTGVQRCSPPDIRTVSTLCLESSSCEREREDLTQLLSWKILDALHIIDVSCPSRRSPGPAYSSVEVYVLALRNASQPDNLWCMSTDLQDSTTSGLM